MCLKAGCEPSLDSSQYFRNYDSIIENRKEVIIVTRSGDKSVYMDYFGLKSFLKPYFVSEIYLKGKKRMKGDLGTNRERNMRTNKRSVIVKNMNLDFSKNMNLDKRKIYSNNNNNLGCSVSNALPPVWIDFQYPTQLTMEMLSFGFGIHSLTIRNCLLENEAVEKYEYFENYHFISIRESHLIPKTNYWRPVQVFIVVPIDRSIIFTMHNGPVLFIPNVISRILYSNGENEKNEALKISKCFIPRSEWIMYLVFDSIVDCIREIEYHVLQEIFSLEELVLILDSNEQNDLLRRINSARLSLSDLRMQLNRKNRILINLLSPPSWLKNLKYYKNNDCNENNSDESLGNTYYRNRDFSTFSINNYDNLMEFGEKIQIYLRDVLDHIISMTNSLEQARESLDYLTSTYLAKISNEMSSDAIIQNQRTKYMTAITTIVLPANLIPSIWGMNVKMLFADLSDHNGFIILISLVVVFVLSSTYIFIKMRWV